MYNQITKNNLQGFFIFGAKNSKINSLLTYCKNLDLEIQSQKQYGDFERLVMAKRDGDNIYIIDEVHRESNILSPFTQDTCIGYGIGIHEEVVESELIKIMMDSGIMPMRDNLSIHEDLYELVRDKMKTFLDQYLPHFNTI